MFILMCLTEEAGPEFMGVSLSLDHAQKVMNCPNPLWKVYGQDGDKFLPGYFDFMKDDDKMVKPKNLFVNAGDEYALILEY